jgi:hypothetical protein
MRWISSIGGAIATAAAVLVLVSLPTDHQVVEAVETPIDVEDTFESTTEPFVDEQPGLPDLDVPDLGEGIADVLAGGGYTQFIGSEELTERLPDDVVQVLVNDEAVLVIPSEEEGE